MYSRGRGRTRQTSRTLTGSCHLLGSLVVEGHVAIIPGGYRFDGDEISPLDEIALRAECAAARAKGIDHCAISCVFAPVRQEQVCSAETYSVVLAQLCYCIVQA